MSEILQSRYDQLVRRVADLKGGGSKVNDALTELFPMFDVENVPPELLLLMGSRLALGGENLGAPGAGNLNIVMLRNPGDSGSIITVLEIRASSSTTQRFVWGPTQNTFPTAEPTALTDTRIFGEGTVGQVLSDVGVVAGPSFGHTHVLANTSLVLAVPRGLAVLGPGAAFAVGNAAANTTLATAFTWVERVAQPSELNL